MKSNHVSGNDKTEILLKVALSTIPPTPSSNRIIFEKKCLISNHYIKSIFLRYNITRFTTIYAISSYHH